VNLLFTGWFSRGLGFARNSRSLWFASYLQKPIWNETSGAITKHTRTGGLVDLPQIPCWLLRSREWPKFLIRTLLPPTTRRSRADHKRVVFNVLRKSHGAKIAFVRRVLRKILAKKDSSKTRPKEGSSGVALGLWPLFSWGNTSGRREKCSVPPLFRDSCLKVVSARRGIPQEPSKPGWGRKRALLLS